ncbi:phosphatidyl-N-methylethanolamine N-methyltransferase [Parastagonospora nodorum]|uniref:Phosphatidyl-N-methylethanolamine N-methyltransferase n=1 Tax=Phaeosphaeria nodorum (strain SN15 / ATCC MYA-4574 / FGSC 10173) TaxID=321614 RepID=A0A7U2F6X0_PHANO|nr:phosphatidyl-N-methylethanolamine N-methyltransferase [Parastagonospora nodorum]QRC99848.1 phosphatidyl-N-methylethanolamine N-methyltransferase [Parastagonospora nodorum SN15]KAH3933687.1 phosphatidyl-N-methylethanolamine N-methyltransferase [Parastagonospora nodorum]KAH3941034.1 phosphatidyl-N-methylethanolamine N-methyltransferase [Parastagonospora nodorum]KAH3957975.1 phosphatidyl-N-methylethanolamine N-methyltransferase [Parastagonospora nodorum]
MSTYIDFNQRSLWVSAASILFNPTFWNIAAQQEYHNKVITKLFGGNPRLGCYALAVTIFSLGIFRDYLYNEALAAQPTHPALLSPLVKYSAIPLFLTGNTLVLTSMYALGVTGTYLGDYFGILMDAPVTTFPFNVSEAPMYHGSTLSFLATALWFGKPAGVLLTGVVAVAYGVARRWEDPFTGEIYAKRERERKGGKKGI